VASDAVDFPRPTRLLLACPASLKESAKVKAENQHWAFVVANSKSSLDPCAHSMFMNAEQIGDLPYCVGAVDFDKAVIGSAMSHDVT
jgi:hypothetical protein